MPHIINNHKWTLPSDIIEKASREAKKQNLQTVYLSNGARKGDSDFLFYKDEERKEVAFIIDENS